MPSVQDYIRQEQEAIKTEEEGKKADAREYEEYQKRMTAENERSTQQGRLNTLSFFRESRLQEEFSELEKLTRNARHHDLIINPEPPEPRVELVWGERYTITQNGVHYEKHWLEGYKDYSSIWARVNYAGTIRIWGSDTQDLELNEWRGDREKLKKALAVAFMNPRRVNTTESKDREEEERRKNYRYESNP